MLNRITHIPSVLKETPPPVTATSVAPPGPPHDVCLPDPPLPSLPGSDPPLPSLPGSDPPLPSLSAAQSPTVPQDIESDQPTPGTPFQRAKKCRIDPTKVSNITRSMAYWMVDTLQPYSAIEKPSFRYEFNLLNFNLN